MKGASPNSAAASGGGDAAGPSEATASLTATGTTGGGSWEPPQAANENETRIRDARMTQGYPSNAGRGEEAAVLGLGLLGSEANRVLNQLKHVLS